MSYQQPEEGAADGESQVEDDQSCLETAEFSMLSSQDTVTIPTTAFGLSEESTIEPERPLLADSSIAAADPVDGDRAWHEITHRFRSAASRVCVFAGERPRTANAPAEDVFMGDAFARQWRSTTHRDEDFVIDATWPRALGPLAWERIEERVQRFCPDLVVVLLNGRESRDGLSALPRFERRLEALITSIRTLGALPVFAITMPQPPDEDIDAVVFREAIFGVAKERDVAVIAELEMALTAGAESLAAAVATRIAHAVTDAAASTPSPTVGDAAST